MKRSINALSNKYSRSRAFDRCISVSIDGSLLVNGLSKGIYDTSEKLFSYGNGYDSACTLYRISLLDPFVRSEHDDGNGVLLKVLSHSVNSRGEFEKLVYHAVVKSCGTCDTVSDQYYYTGLGLVDLNVVILDL